MVFASLTRLTLPYSMHPPIAGILIIQAVAQMPGTFTYGRYSKACFSAADCPRHVVDTAFNGLLLNADDE